MTRLFTGLPVTFNQFLYLLEHKITEHTVGRKSGVILRGLTSGFSDKELRTRSYTCCERKKGTRASYLITRGLNSAWMSQKETSERHQLLCRPKTNHILLLEGQ